MWGRLVATPDWDVKGVGLAPGIEARRARRGTRLDAQYEKPGPGAQVEGGARSPSVDLLLHWMLRATKVCDGARSSGDGYISEY